MSKHGNRPASNDSASVTVDPTNLGATAAAPIGREIDRRVDPTRALSRRSASGAGTQLLLAAVSDAAHPSAGLAVAEAR